MIAPKVLFVGAAFALCWVSRSEAQTAAVEVLPRGASYPQIRTHLEQSVRLGLTKAQQLDVLRETVRAGPLGQRGLDRIFKNFEGPGSIDPTIPGVRKTVGLAASSNLQVRKGAARTLVYASRLHNDSRFRLIALNEPIYGSNGKMDTDKDLRWQHRATGQLGRIEVKDVKPSSQRSKLADYKRQIDKMAAEYRRTGELQAWVNRRAVVPELRTYATRRGIPVYENVVTSERGLGKDQKHFRQVIADLDRQATVRANVRTLTAGAEAGFGLLLLIESAPEAYTDLRASLDTSSRSTATLLRLGEHGSKVVAGSALLVRGSVQIASRFSRTATATTRLTGVSRWAGRAGLAAFVLAEGFTIWQYQAGAISERQFMLAQTNLVAGLAGGAGGAWLGFKAGAISGGFLGSFFGPGGTAIGAGIGGTIGALGGGFGGAWATSSLACYSVSSYYQFKDKQQEEKFEKFIFAHYGARHP